MLCVLTLVSFFIPFGPEMQIGISIMLAFSVFKLRLSDDVPVQSDNIPLINNYFTMCMTFSLSAMIWFSMMNKLREKPNVPNCIRYIVLNYICYLMCDYQRTSRLVNECGCLSFNKMSISCKKKKLTCDKSQKKIKTAKSITFLDSNKEDTLLTHSACKSLPVSPLNLKHKLFTDNSLSSPANTNQATTTTTSNTANPDTSVNSGVKKDKQGIKSSATFNSLDSNIYYNNFKTLNESNSATFNNAFKPDEFRKIPISFQTNEHLSKRRRNQHHAKHSGKINTR